MTTPLEAMIVSQKATIKEVLKCLDQNAQGIVFVVDESQKLVGVVTDGDVRRALIEGEQLGATTSKIMNRNFVALPIGTKESDILKKLSSKIRHIPLVDSDGVVKDYSCIHKMHQIPIMEPFLSGNEQNYVMDCLQTKWISSQGKYVTQFEEDFVKVMGTGGYALAVSNGTVALHLALVTLGIGPGDEVIVPDLTFAASINTIIHAGATPVLVDVNQDDWCIDIEAVKKAITPKTKAIMPVHLYGQPCKMDEIMALAKQHKLFIVEDCAESQGSLYKNKPTGSFGEAGCFSFFGNKMITTGEGGMIIFKNQEHFEKARMLRDHGMSKQKRYWHLDVGYNYRLTNLQAAIGVAQLEQFGTILKNKLKIAEEYYKKIEKISGITLPPKHKDCLNINWLFSILLDSTVFGDRDKVIEKLQANGIQTRPLFYPLHEMEPYKKYLKNTDFSVSTAISRTGLSLPSSVSLTGKDIRRVCEALASISSFRSMKNLY